MIRTIRDEYLAWLKEYIKTKGVAHKQPAIMLILQLKELKSIDELQAVLSKVSLAHSPAFFTDPAAASPDCFIRKFQSILATVGELRTGADNADKNCVFIELISTKMEQTKSLIYLLKRILLDPRSYLYPHILGLLSLLQNDSKEPQNDPKELQAMVNHLEQQPQKLRPQKPRPGSFDEVFPLDAQHQAGLDLLRNNAATYSDKSPESRRANHLLQTLLVLYQTIYTPPVYEACTIS